MAPIIVYGAHTTRSDIVLWACRELNCPFEFQAVDWLAGEHKAPAFLAKNPLGQLPAAETEDGLITESGAIVLYLGEKFGAGTPLAVDTTAKRVNLVKWLLLANSTMCDDLFKKNGRVLDALETVLSKQEYLCGSAFTLADISVACYLAWIPYFTKVDPEWKEEVWAAKWPATHAYYKRCLARPAGAESVPLGWLSKPEEWLV